MLIRNSEEDQEYKGITEGDKKPNTGSDIRIRLWYYPDSKLHIKINNKLAYRTNNSNNNNEKVKKNKSVKKYINKSVKDKYTNKG